MMTSRQPRLGVCYYPEHWPREIWARDAARMVDVGIELVRIGEFAWSEIEGEPGVFTWGWLDDAIETLSAAGLNIILGTVTATPPKWLIDQHPEILAHDDQGRPRRFGSRRHYCFSSPVYREETTRIVTAMAERYGAHEAITAWQTDNEYGCHDTTRSYSPAAAQAFRGWLKDKYKTIDALNDAWGAVFWSQRYRSFAEVDLHHLTVTEPNPSHVLDFYRFSSDQVVSYNKLQADILRKHSPGRDIIHNFMGYYAEFDHFDLGADIDVASWDSYPLGFLDLSPYPDAAKKFYMRQGHPDFAGFHHDLYRACSKGRWAVMEQQPGPVNWAANNPAPLPGMAALWAEEAAAHGAEFVSYFRWRQAPFAQEQMHAGLLRVDDAPAPAYGEAKEVNARWRDDSHKETFAEDAAAPAAMIFSYDALWMFEIQPQGAGWSYYRVFMEWYTALREHGLDVDIVPPGADLSAYKLVVIPSLPHIDEATLQAIKATSAQVIFGPRSGSKTQSLQVPRNLAPGPLQELIPLKIAHSESFADFHSEEIYYDGAKGAGLIWFDHAQTQLAPLARTASGVGALYRQNNIWMLMTVPDKGFRDALLKQICLGAGIALCPLPEGLRLRRTGETVTAVNYAHVPAEIPDALAPATGEFMHGGKTLPPAGVARWRSS